MNGLNDSQKKVDISDKHVSAGLKARTERVELFYQELAKIFGEQLPVCAFRYFQNRESAMYRNTELTELIRREIYLIYVKLDALDDK